MTRPRADDEDAFRTRVRRALDESSGDVALARVEFDRLDRVAEYFGEGVAEFVGDQLVQRMIDVAINPAAVHCPPGGVGMVLVPVRSPDPDDLAAAAWDLMEGLSGAIDVGFTDVSIGCTVGLADPSVLVDRSVAGLINAASAASRQASAMGSRSAAVFEGRHELSGRRGQLDKGIFTAWRSGELATCFRPQVRLADGGIVGAEALVEWHHPTYGVVAAAEFMPEARRSGIVRDIDRLVLSEAARAASTWPTSVRLSFELSTASLDNPGVIDGVTTRLERAGLAPEQVTLEVAGARDERGSRGYPQRLAALKARGLHLRLGGLGACHDYLEVLDDGLFDELRIDAALVHGSAAGPNAPALSALVGFAHALGLQVIAEGISTEEERDAIAAAGCPVGMGDLLYPTIPIDDMRALVEPGGYQG